MFIQTEKTPNPATLKFLPGETVIKGGAVEFKLGDDVSTAPLAARLFGLDGVVGIFLTEDFIAITKSDNVSWDDLQSLALAALMQHFSTGQPALLPQPEKENLTKGQGKDPALEDEPEDEIIAQIKELIATRVRPAVMMDGGDIVFNRFEDGVVYLEMRGACAGCPSATATLKIGVENMLRHYVPEVMEVRPVEVHEEIS